MEAQQTTRDGAIALEQSEETASLRTFRPDIEGLRAIAIVLVVAFHAEVPGFAGGFVGVDVFFVVSGYLITRNLLAEISETGRVALLAFWSRRIRRLVPALALMLLVALGLASLVLSPLEWRSTADQAQAAALYVSNLYFATRGQGYFAGDGVDQSVFLHTWSLGVEEQFYVVWPLAFLGLAWVVRRWRLPARRTLVAGFVAVLACSFALSVYSTGRGSELAFFGLPSRTWEFAAAGALAGWAIPAVFQRRGAQVAAAVSGTVLIAWATVGLSNDSPYPGARALLPVGGALLIVLAGEARTPAASHPVTWALGTRPVRWVGRVSYSWYLWHWPLMLLAEAWLDRRGVVVRLGAGLAALPVAAVTHRLVERPVRFSRRLANTRRTYALGAAATALVVGSGFVMAAWADDEIEGDDLLSRVAAARADLGRYPCPGEQITASDLTWCEAGDREGSRTILFVGDSHAGHWLGAFAAAAEGEGFRLIARWNPGCPAIPVATEPFADLREGDCETFRAENAALADQLDLDGVVVSNSSNYGYLIRDPEGGRANDVEAQVRVWTAGYRTFLEDFGRRRVPVGAVADNPAFFPNPLDCLAQHGAAEPCALPRDQVLKRTAAIRAAEAAVRDGTGGVPTFDVTDQICGPATCRVVVDDVVVYSDFSHLNGSFTRRQVPAIRTFLRAVVAEAATRP